MRIFPRTFGEINTEVCCVFQSSPPPPFISMGEEQELEETLKSLGTHQHTSLPGFNI